MHGTKVQLVLQMASSDMEQRVRRRLGVPADQPMEFYYQPCTFSPMVRQLVMGNNKGLGVLGSGINGDV